MMQILMTIFMMLTCVACGGPRYADYFPYHDDGVPKPKVALVPLNDSTNCGLGWNFTEELTEGMYYQLMNTGELYVLSPQEIGPAWDKRDSYEFFGTGYGYVKDFCGADMVAVLELVDHAVVPYDACTGMEITSANCSVCTKAILMRVRIKVVDIRCQVPRVVLYEVAKCLYPLDPAYRCNDLYNIGWGEPAYTKTQCGMAHQRMIRQLSERLEQVARCAR